jgi:hypothetical protein
MVCRRWRGSVRTRFVHYLGQHSLRGGVAATSRKWREATFDGADGVVIYHKNNVLELDHHPSSERRGMSLKNAATRFNKDNAFSFLA